MKTRILLDISRSIFDAGIPTPTGVMRVDQAYAEHFLNTMPDRVLFTSKNIFGRLGFVKECQARTLLTNTSRLWHGERASRLDCWLLRMYSIWIRVTLLWRTERRFYPELVRQGNPIVYLIVSDALLESPNMVCRLKEQTGARFFYFVHDLIPLQFPEYFALGIEKVFKSRIEGAAQLADVIITNSEDTRTTFLQMINPTDHIPHILVAPLGVTQPATVSSSAPSTGAPYFVIIGTIEPRKNHLLLFNIWRQLRSRLGKAAPRLVVIGRRGWENENIIDMIERSRALAGFIEEHGRLSDAATMKILAGARALLMPSFAEGYGLPLAEALTIGVPAICSDIPALREVGREVPEFIDPLDGPSWQRAILDYMPEDSPRRQAQLERLKTWPPPSWEAHFKLLDTLIEHLGSKSPTT